MRPNLGADSLDLVELVMGIEETFDLAINDEETNACATVGDALALIQSKARILEAA